MKKKMQAYTFAVSVIVLFSFILSHLTSDAAAQRRTDPPIFITEDVLLGDHVWDNITSPYQITGNLEVGAAASLTIKPGVTVEFADGVSLTIEGKLIAHGTKTDRITLTGVTKTRGSWLHLLILGEEGAINKDCSFRYVDFEYGGKDLFQTPSDAGYLEGILYLYNAQARVENCVFRESGTNGAFATSNSSFQMRENQFLNNQGYALSLIGNDGQLVDSWTDSNLSDLTATGNGYDGVGLIDLVTHDMVLEYTGLPYYLLKGGLALVNASLTIEPEVTMIFDSGSGLALEGGTLNAAGTETKPILLTGMTKEPGAWSGVEINGSFSWDLTQPMNPIVWINNEGSRLSHVTIEYGGRFTANLTLDHAKAVLSDCKILYSGKYGIYQDTAEGSVIERSHITNSQDSGIHRANTDTGPILASNNWWGDASGPYNKIDNLTGTGNEVEEDSAIFLPFLTSPDQKPGVVAEADILNLTATPQRWFAPADGITKVPVNITLHDGLGNPVPGRRVLLETTMGTVMDGDITNIDGQATAYVSSNEVGDATLTPKMALGQTYPARSASAEVTFTEPSTVLDVFPDAEAPYVNHHLTMSPLPITVGVPVTITANVRNPSTYTLSVEMQFGKHNYGIGLPLDIIDTVSAILPPDSTVPVSASWTPLAPGHQCIGIFGSFDLAPALRNKRFSFSYAPAGFALPWLRNTNPKPATLVDQNTKNAGKKVKDDVDKIRKAVGAFSDLTGGIDNIVSGANFSVGLIQGFMLNQFFNQLFNMVEEILNALQTDPPRQDFRIYAEAETIDLPPLEFDATVSPERAQALSAMLNAHLNIFSNGRAAQISYDRYGGAVAAEEQTWASQQAATLLHYYKETGKAFNDAANAVDLLLQVIENENVEDVFISKDDFIAYQTRLATKGFTDSEKEAASFFDATDNDLAKLIENILAQDPDEVARETVQQKLADLSKTYHELAPLLINLDSFGENDTHPTGIVARNARTIPQNKLVRVYSTETPIPIANPLNHASSITLRIRRLDLPSDWMVRLSRHQFSLAPGEMTTVTLTVGAGTAAPQGIEPRVALEAYADGTLLGGVSLTTVVPRQTSGPDETVATPIITPNGGAHIDTVIVSLSCQTDGANIYYTTDGSEPTTESATLYTTPFTLTESATVQARAYKPDFRQSEIASASFIISSVSYTLTVSTTGQGHVSLNPDNALYAEGATVQLTATPDTGSVFTGWSGDLAGTNNPATLTMDNNKNVTANFEQILLPLPAPQDVEASDGLSGVDTNAIRIQWSPVASATHYMVFRSDEEGSAKTTLSNWITDLFFKDQTAKAGVEYYYWIKAAADGIGTRASTFSTSNTGYWHSLNAPTFDYKLTYKNCSATIDHTHGTGGILVTGTSLKSTIKIQVQKQDVAEKADKPGKYMYLNDWPPIPVLSINGDLKQIFTNAPISVLNAPSGYIKKITAKNTNIKMLNAKQLGTVKMNAIGNATAIPSTQEATAIYTTLAGVPTQISVTGIILEELVTPQEVKYIKAASKIYTVKSTTGKQKQLSIGGIGDEFNVVADVWGNQTPASLADCRVTASVIKSISANGGSVMPATILANVQKITSTSGIFTMTPQNKILLSGNIRPHQIKSDTDIKEIKAKSKKYKNALSGGFIGYAADATHLEVLAPNIATIEGNAGVSGKFVAGANANGIPDYTGIIKTIKTKKDGQIRGEAHLLGTSKGIKFKPDQGPFFTVHNQAP